MKEPSIIPKILKGIKIGMSEKEFKETRPVQRWFEPPNKEKTYFEQFSENPFFTDALYGLWEGKLTFVKLTGGSLKEYSEKGINSILAGLIKGSINKYGTNFKRSLIEHKLWGINCIDAVLEWKVIDEGIYPVENILVALRFPLPSSMKELNEKVESAWVLFKYYLYIIAPSSSIAPLLLLDPDSEKKIEDEEKVEGAFKEFDIENFAGVILE